MARNYSIQFLVAALLVFLGAALTNLVADPYGIWGTPRISGLNISKYSVAHDRIQHFAEWAHWSKPPEIILLGTSRTADGLRTSHPAFRNDNTYNMALGGQPIRESLLLFKHALKSGSLKKAVIGLDFFAFNTYWATDLVDQEKRLMPGHNFDLLFNASTFSDSFVTIQQSLPDMKVLRAAQAADSMPGSPAPQNAAQIRRLFLEVEKIYVTYNRPFPYHIHSYSNQKTGENTLEDFREILKIAHANNIELYLFISPSHAWHWEGLADVGLWEKWEGWKRELVRINQEESAKVGKSPYPLWDFSGYNSITTEAVPDAGSSSRMMWYDDSSHYSQRCGDLILDRVLGYTDSSSSVPDDFGKLINGENIDSHLSNIRANRKRYALTHSADVHEMAQMIRREWKHDTSLTD